MKRRDFLLTAAMTGVASTLRFDKLEAALKNNRIAVSSTPDLVAVMGGEPAIMLDRALAKFGGISAFVKKGQTVVLKPNIGWDKTPELAANTNPALVGAMVHQCYSAGAKRVEVFDHTCNQWDRCYVDSGIKGAVEAAGGIMVPANDQSFFRTVSIPQGKKLKQTAIHKSLLDCDVWFNMPILKNHGGAKMTISMKNYMGVVWDREHFHKTDLQQCIADICTFHKRPALNIVDAYRIMFKNGPQGKSVADTALLKTLIVSPDIIAADAASVRFFNQVQKMDISEVEHIGMGQALHLGTDDLNKLRIDRIKI
ncbi:DUF362 domain-containing protein [Microbacter margulisiae]|uniref:Uncharacterized protein (DUF362 family) n=1 Tax=Microbacter margulisiae TaxID=1350067 RepID=A0A7W5DQL4_9PORP|nr:DUF362 domain-containing protein [Microbacter margulisiae]MBB3186759.1 uncharacterized protein (DUF362 family) [Microbacter margulisiae]